MDKLNAKTSRLASVTLLFALLIITIQVITATSVSITNSSTIAAPKRSTDANPKPKRVAHVSGSTKGKKSQTPQREDRSQVNLQNESTSYAQEQLKLMLGYRNTPPTFVTKTRDLFVDVSTSSPGSNISRIIAHDEDGDNIEYSLRPSNGRDASSYFSINKFTGELSLANKQFDFYTNGIKSETSTREDEESEDDKETNKKLESEQENSHSTDALDLQLASKNLYFLNVVATDGRYESVLELKVQVMNSSLIQAALRSISGALNVQLTPEAVQKSQETLDSIMRNKTSDFYDKLYRSASTSSEQQASKSSVVIYPDFVNPSLTRPDSIGSVVELTTTREPEVEPNQINRRIMSQNQEELIAPLESGRPLIQTAPSNGQSHINALSSDGNSLGPHTTALVQQPMVISLVIVCSCMMIALVLLIFIVPISVKRLRRRLKNVERQHEQISQRNSHGSTTIFSGSSSNGSLDHKHNGCSSLSQFTLTSDRSCITGANSTVCRQSSLDSSLAGNSPGQYIQSQRIQSNPLNRVNNGSIVNPVYLHNHQFQEPQVQLPQAAAFTILSHQAQPYQVGREYSYRQQQHIATAQPTIIMNDSQSSPNNIYCPLDDEFYSTITTESTLLDAPNSRALHSSILTDKRNTKTQIVSNTSNCFFVPSTCLQPQMAFEDEHRFTGSRNSDSASSTRSLARFLSLPARHAAHSLTSGPDSDGQPNCQSSGNCKTIARGSQVDRETLNSWELDRHRLRFLNLLDEGQFGLVFRCKLSLPNSRADQVVAVKTLKKGAVREERGLEELLAEIEVMKLVCNHPNVVRILHCCTKDTLASGPESSPILLVMEYVELGKLQLYLENSRINHYYATNSSTINAFESTTDNENSGNNYQRATSEYHLTSRDLIKFIYHVAKGMEYISSKCIVHRDLASRNVLVNSRRICKIGDFGMARHMQSLSGVYERHSRNTKIPVRWMAPEVLLNNRFTTESDVYSFGILMWEIVTLGSTPYRHLKTEQVIDEVARNGERPEKPKYCHSQLYKIMSKCWNENPEDRPTFSWLVRQLDVLLLSADDYIELDKYPDHDYYNISRTSAPNELL